MRARAASTWLPRVGEQAVFHVPDGLGMGQEDNITRRWQHGRMSVDPTQRDHGQTLCRQLSMVCAALQASGVRSGRNVLRWCRTGAGTALVLRGSKPSPVVLVHLAPFRPRPPREGATPRLPYHPRSDGVTDAAPSRSPFVEAGGRPSGGKHRELYAQPRGPPGADLGPVPDLPGPPRPYPGVALPVCSHPIGRLRARWLSGLMPGLGHPSSLISCTRLWFDTCSVVASLPRADARDVIYLSTTTSRVPVKIDGLECM